MREAKAAKLIAFNFMYYSVVLLFGQLGSFIKKRRLTLKNPFCLYLWLIVAKMIFYLAAV